MKPSEMQVCWAAAQFYTGAIDGILGRQSAKAVDDIEALGKYTIPATMSRRQIASAQYCLDILGHEPGEIDGYSGHNTQNAMTSLLYKLSTGNDYLNDRTPLDGYEHSGDIPKQSEVEEFYGHPETEVPSRMVTIELPFSLRLDWDLATKVRRIYVHKLAAEDLKNALIDVHDHYGPDRMGDLGIDRYAGCYSKRKMRGGTSWSMHAHGCAIDFYAAPNGLNTRCPHALFCGAEYKPFLDIMEYHGWLPAIRLWGADAMHFQRAKMG